MSSTSNSNETAITEAEVAKFEQQVTKTRRTRKQFDHARAVQLRIRERLTYDEIAERMDTTRAVVCTNIHKFLKYLEGDSDDVPGNLYAYQANKPDLLETVEYKLLDTVYDILSTGRTPPLKDVALALKTIHEIRRLEAGQSTSNVSVLLKSIEEAHQNPLSIESKQCPTPNDTSISNGPSTPLESPPSSPLQPDSISPTVTPPSSV